jgi:hypothetical protein
MEEAAQAKFQAEAIQIPPEVVAKMEAAKAAQADVAQPDAASPGATRAPATEELPINAT